MSFYPKPAVRSLHSRNCFPFTGAGWIGLIFFLFWTNAARSQHLLPLYEDVGAPLAYYCNNSDAHGTVKPILDEDLWKRPHYSHDSLMRLDRWSNYGRKNGRLTWDSYYGIQKFYRVEPQNAFLVRPVYDLQFGKEFAADRAVYNLTAGLIIAGDFKRKLGYELRFVSGINALNAHQDSLARVFGMMPGWGDRTYALDTNGRYAFQHFSGNLIWRPSKVFNLQAGRDKHFIGDGYRSLFLSDIGPAFPYIKQQTTIWKLQYTSVFAWLQDWTQSPQFVAKDFRNKFASFHYISFNAAKWLNIGVFESVVWQGEDNNRYRGFDVNYLNPIVFFRPVEYSLGSSDNAMLGFSFRLRFNRNNQFYSQLILDEFFLKEIKNWKAGWWANKQGIQAGYKCFNFGMVENLYFQAELNIVRPYTYTHGSPQQNYSNAYAPLAHPLGANFAELFGMLSYRWKGMTLTGKLVAMRYGMDPAGKNYGQNIFLSYLDRSSTDPAHPSARDYGHHLFDGVGTNIFYAEFKAVYQFYPSPLRVEFTAGARSQNSDLIHQKSSYITAGFVLPLWRSYRDY